MMNGAPMNVDLKGRVALVTGGASGMGLASGEASRAKRRRGRVG